MVKNYLNYLGESKNKIKVKPLELELIHGEDVRYWYLEDRYEKVSFRDRYNCSLYNSCYRYQNRQSIFDLYVENPEKLGLLVVISPNDGLLARSVWIKLDSPEGYVFIDHPYLIYPEHEQFFENYVDANRCLLPMQVYTGIPIYSVLSKKISTCYPPYFDSIPYLEESANRLVVGNRAGARVFYSSEKDKKK